MSHVVVCPHCGVALSDAQTHCAICGAVLRNHPAKPHGNLLTGRMWTDLLLGAFVQYLTHLVTARVLVRYVPRTITSPSWAAQPAALGRFILLEMFWAIAFGLLLYYGLRRVYLFVARGSGYAALVLLAILLGAFFTCRPLLY